MALRHYFWDSCVFIAYLNNDEAAYDVDSLRTFISELGKKDGCVIYTSAIALAEISPKRLKGSEYGAFEEFLRDYKSSIHVIDAGPNESQTARRLKDIPFNKSGSKRRVLTTGDAIMLSTALELEDTYKIKIDAFHTYDNGRGKGHPEGKGIPLLSFHEWLEEVSENELADRVKRMNRCKPIHQQGRLF